MPERIRVNYRHRINFLNSDTNIIGANTDTTGLRTVPTPGGDIAYVRKFGTDYLIKQVTDITDPVDVNMTFTVKAADGTTLGSIHLVAESAAVLFLPGLRLQRLNRAILK
jgi:hypothetical protein